MIKKRLIIFSLLGVLCAASLWFYGIVAAPILQYAEGWQTFYYDTELMSNESTGNYIKAFLLQFFVHPWTGAMVMTAILLLVIGIVSGFAHCIKPKNRYVKAVIPCLIVVVTMYVGLSLASWMGGVTNLGLLGLGSEGEKQTIIFKKLSNLARQQDWDGVIDICQEHTPVNNLLYQNILNMALAEKCLLGDRLFEQPVHDINSIYVNQIENPEIAAMMSDIYFSMGHIAQSQRYAFEANEKMNNLSPRLLQRLIQTNALYGQKAVASKYQYILSKTLYYKGYEYADNEKQRCIFEDNRFSGIRGIDDDLLHIARNTRGTRQCRVTLHFLGSLYILAGYSEQFESMVNEFGGSKDLPKPMPEYFQKYSEKIQEIKE